MEGENDVIEYDGLIYERTDDMSVLSEFCCGVFDMDDFIHHHLQNAVLREGLETYIIKSGKEVLAVLSICESVLKTRIATGELIEYKTEEIEYLAVRKEMQRRGIGRSIINWIVERFRGKMTMLSVSAYRDIDTKYTAAPFYEKCGFLIVSKPKHDLDNYVKMARII